MADVFISYAREDGDFARRIVQGLEAEGLSVWWDHTIPPGKTWDQVIARNIEDAKACIIIWSRHSVGSDWVKEEATLARDGSKYLPVQADSSPPPVGFRRIQAAQLPATWTGDTSNPQWRLLVGEARALARGEARPAPGPDPAPTPTPGPTPPGVKKPSPWIAIGGVAVVAAALFWFANRDKGGDDFVPPSPTPEIADATVSPEAEIAPLPEIRPQEGPLIRPEYTTPAETITPASLVGAYAGYIRWKRPNGETAGNDNTRWSIKADGTFTGLTESDKGTWALDGNRILMRYTTAPYSTLRGTVSNGVISGSGTVDNWVGTFEMRRQ